MTATPRNRLERWSVGIVSALVALCCCSAAARAATAPTPCPSLLERVRADPSLSGFLGILESVGYQPALSDKGSGLGVTLLAPTNEALAKPLPSQSSGSSGSASSFNSSTALFSAVPAAARAVVGGHFLKGFVARGTSDFFQRQRQWFGTLATSKRPGEQDRALGVEVVGVVGGGGGEGSPPSVVLRGDGGTTARATFVDDHAARACGDGLLKLDGVLWPFKF